MNESDIAKLILRLLSLAVNETLMMPAIAKVRAAAVKKRSVNEP